MDLKAVIIGDIVNSTQFSRQKTTKWLDGLISLLSEDPSIKWSLSPEIYRGDSFQGVLEHADDAARVAILARAVMRANATNTDMRIAIGIGKTESLTDRAGTSDGEAFRLAGRLADNIRKQKARIAISFATPSNTLDASLDLLETLIESWTSAQSEVVSELLQNQTATQIAEKLSISQPAVSQRIAASKWWAVENFLRAYPSYLTPYTT